MPEKYTPVVGDWVIDCGHVLYFIGTQAKYPYQGINGALATVSEGVRPTSPPEWADEIMGKPAIGGMYSA